MQMHMVNERYQQNSHKWQTWDLNWQLGFQWHRRGIELVLQVPRLFHNATVSQCGHFLLLHIYMYLLFETSPGWLPGWRGFLTQFGGGHSAPMYLLFVPNTDLMAAEGISALQTSSCYNRRSTLHQHFESPSTLFINFSVMLILISRK